MGTQENKDVVRQVEEAWDKNRLDELEQHFTSDFDNSGSVVPGMPVGLETAKQAHGMALQAMPDRRVIIEDIVAEGDTVIVRGQARGTDTGGFSWMGVGPTGRPIKVDFVSVYTLRDGKIAKHWGLNDAFGLAMQLGVIPSPGATAAKN